MEEWVAIDEGQTKMLMCAQYNGEWIEKKVLTGMDATKEYVAEQVNLFIDSLPFKPNGIGMGVTGLVENNKIVLSDQSGCEGLDGEMMSREGCKCYLINDVKAAMVCESENYQNDECIALIMAGSGFALSVREKSTTVLGRHGWAGEIGSNYYQVNGKMEMLDSISGGIGILNKAGCDAETFIERLNNNDSEAVELINQGGYYFGLALMDVIHTFNPEYIILGGSTIMYKNYMNVAIETAKKYTRETMFNDCKIVSAQDPRRIVALGARLYGYKIEHPN